MLGKSGTIGHMLCRFYPGLSGLSYSLVLFLALAFSSFAQQISPPISPAERSLAAAQFATERLAVWQQRLNLKDWNITIEMARTGDLKPKTLGNIHWDADKKTAVIRVLDPADYRLPQAEMLKDMEFTVVHELIHLDLSSLPRSDASRGDEEHAVNRIAEALLELDRRK
jgi:hypothetical protein